MANITYNCFILHFFEVLPSNYILVTSPGGVTQRAIEEFEKNGVKETIIKAIEAAANKSKELGDN